MAGLYYEDFEVGETIHHGKRRTISEGDIQRFCDMTMNQQPLHIGSAFAADTDFGERIVNGLLTMSLAVGLTIADTTDVTDSKAREYALWRSSGPPIQQKSAV